MFKRNYYCLVAGLPDILIDDSKLSETTAKFKEELKTQLHPEDFNLVELLFLSIDNENILNQLTAKNKIFKPNGKYSLEELEEQIKEPTYILEYLKSFIIAYKTETPVYQNLSWENQLQSLYYNYVINCKNDFLEKWFFYDLNIKNILTAINCRQFEIELEQQLIPISTENDVYTNLRKSTPKRDTLVDSVPNIDRILQLTEKHNNIIEREKGIDIEKWNYLDDLTFFHYFTLEKILSFVIKLGILERWFALDVETGCKMFEMLISNLKTSYQFSEEFKVQRKK